MLTADCTWPITCSVLKHSRFALQDQTKAAASNDVIRIYVDSPAGVCRAEISRALVQQQLQVCMAANLWLWHGDVSTGYMHRSCLHDVLYQRVPMSASSVKVKYKHIWACQHKASHTHMAML